MPSRELSRSAGSVRLPSFAMHWGCFAKRHFLILYFLVIAQWLTFSKNDNGRRQNPNTNTWQSFWDLHLGGVPYTSSISIKLCINQGHCCRRFTGSPESSLANRFSNQDGMPYPKSPQRTPPSPDSQGRTVWNVGVPFFLSWRWVSVSSSVFINWGLLVSSHLKPDRRWMKRRFPSSFQCRKELFSDRRTARIIPHPHKIRLVHPPGNLWGVCLWFWHHLKQVYIVRIYIYVCVCVYVYIYIHPNCVTWCNYRLLPLCREFTDRKR